jgi:hypothetical protein
MSKRKIADCLNVRINVGNYQHIELTKYAEEEIEYSTDVERIQKEDNLRDDLLASLIKSMKTIPERLNKGVESAQEVEELIKKSIPDWLSKNIVPNIANMAKKNDIKIAAEQKDNIDDTVKTKEIVKSIDIFEDPKVNIKENKKALSIVDSSPEIPSIDKVEDLFENNSVVVEKDMKTEKKIEKKVEEKKVPATTSDGFDDLFDDDIFKE